MAVDEQRHQTSTQRAALLADRLEQWMTGDLAAIVAALRRADPVIPCGVSDPDPRTEYRMADARAAIGATDGGGCGRLVVLWHAFRCVECGRWFHRSCIERHFRGASDDQTHG
jgi:hypothetical protein